jgi:putative ABC transport system permease protein
VALLRAFGSAKSQLSKMMSIEIGLLGFLAGVVACIFAEVISAVVSFKMNIPMQLHWEIWLILPILMLVICSLIGYYRLRYLADISPLQSLREIN